VLQGDATFVTGGAVVDGIETQPGEIRGRVISGGDSRHLKKGDFAVVPARVPHWISEIEGKEFLYIVVPPLLEGRPLQSGSAQNGQ